MQVRALALLLVAGAASAQQTRDPYAPDEPTPHEPPPTIYVPVPPPVYYPPGTPPPYAPYAPEVQPPPKKSGGFVFRFDLGGAYRYALKDQFGAGAMRFFLGGESGRLGFGGIIDIELGGSRGGLFYAVLDMGFGFYGRIGNHVRLGAGPQLGFMAIQRATDSNPFEDLIGVMVGLHADLSIDLIQSRSSALIAFGRVRYDYLDTGPVSPYSHGASVVLGIGVRL